MTSYPPQDPRIAASPYAIGAPGRTAAERSAGPPETRGGLADVELSAATLPGLVMRAATVRGLQHRAADEPRQDAFAISYRDEQAGIVRAIAVVCDGVGQFGRSAEAAALVSRCLARLRAEGVGWQECFKRANESLREHAETVLAQAQDGGDADGMATTAVAMIVHREGADWVGELAWVGDSPAWHLGGDLQWMELSDAHVADADDDLHSTGVRPLPSQDGGCTERQFRVTGGALFVMSDGVGKPLGWSATVRHALAGWWEQPPEPFAFAAQVGFARLTHIDDRTVIGIWPDLVAEAAAAQEAAPDPDDPGAVPLSDPGDPGPAPPLGGDGLEGAQEGSGALELPG